MKWRGPLERKAEKRRLCSLFKIDILLYVLFQSIPYMENENQVKITREVLSHPRNQREEVQALQDTLYVLGGKWKLSIINSICNGNKRFKDIERSIPGITTWMLSKELLFLGFGRLPVSKDFLLTGNPYSTLILT